MKSACDSFNIQMETLFTPLDARERYELCE